MSEKEPNAEKDDVSRDKKSIPMATWGEIVDKWTKEGKMVVRFTSPTRFGAKEALGFSEDERPRIEGCETFAHEETRPFRTLYVAIEHQQALDHLHKRLREVTGEYTNAYMTKRANKLSIRRQRIPDTFAVGRY